MGYFDGGGEQVWGTNREEMKRRENEGNTAKRKVGKIALIFLK